MENTLEIGQHQNMEELYANVRSILASARQRAYTAINFAMVESYWLIGQQIVENELRGAARAEYGKGVLKELADRLTAEFGKGFDESNLRYMRLFYRSFPIRDTLRHELTWSHYRRLLSVENEQTRQWYMNEAADSVWSTRQLDRQISTLYYERLLASKEKAPVVDEAKEKLGKLTHEDVGQMDSYIRMFDALYKTPDDNPTLGIILCSQKNEAIVKYSVLNEGKQIFASRYKLYLPTEEEFKRMLENI